MLLNLRKCFNYFKENTTMVVYLLVGDYMSNNQFKSILNENDKLKIMNALLSELDTKSSENTQSMRKLLQRSNRLKTNHIVPIQATVLTVYEAKQEQVYFKTK